MQTVKKMTKKQVDGIQKYRRITVCLLSCIMFVSLWFKIVFHPNWHFSFVFIEFFSLFLIFLINIIANIKNDFPIFNMRYFQFTKEFTYSIVLSFSLLFLFIIYKNIVDSNFISYIASLSLHDFCSVLVFSFPIFLIIIYIIYFSFKIVNHKINKQKILLVYDREMENRLHHYKTFTIQSVFVLIILSLWIKVGFQTDFSFWDIEVEIFSLIVICFLWIVGNIKNKLPFLYNVYLKFDRYFFFSLLLPYLLIIFYSVFNADFRFLISSLERKKLISFLVYLSPFFLGASILFYLGVGSPGLENKGEKKSFIKKNKVRENAVLSLFITFFLVSGIFYYCFTYVVFRYTIENILQAIIIFFPLAIVIYLIIYSGIQEINK